MPPSNRTPANPVALQPLQHDPHRPVAVTCASAVWKCERPTFGYEITIFPPTSAPTPSPGPQGEGLLQHKDSAIHTLPLPFTPCPCHPHASPAIHTLALPSAAPPLTHTSVDTLRLGLAG
eukprot:352890-Chlamydomonas_euryale.AAC.4